MARTTRRLLSATTFLLLVTALPAAAQDAATPDYTYAIDTVWVAVCGALVFLMQMGFGLVETGLTRSKNAVNIMTKNAADLIVGVPLYWAVGGALAYGASKGGLFGTTGFFDPESIMGDGVAVRLPAGLRRRRRDHRLRCASPSG